MVAFFYVAQFIIQNASLFLFANLVIRLLLLFGSYLKLGLRGVFLRLRVPVLLLVGAFFLQYATEAFFARFVEWRPKAPTSSALVGTWIRVGGDRLELDDDGTAFYVAGQREKYSWHIEGCKLVFTVGAMRLRTFPIIRFNGEYRILHDYDKNAGDFFLNDLGFGKIRPCSERQSSFDKGTNQMVVLYHMVWFIMRATFLFLFANVPVRLMLLSCARVGWKRFVLRIRVSVVLLMTACLLGEGLQGIFQSFTEWCPEPTTKSVLAGTWSKGADRLELKEDGTAFYVARRRDKYLWHIDDYELVLTDMGGTRLHTWRIIRFNCEYRILDDYDENAPELALRDLGFSRIQE
ncbi:MAG: hypothetical protein ACYSUP_02750 [Planctomycetota bacterium]|jgi:hypothetical protein